MTASDVAGEPLRSLDLFPDVWFMPCDDDDDDDDEDDDADAENI